MIDRVQFPNLTDQNHRVTSPPSPNYNCVAWAVGDSSHWWEPNSFWPMPNEVHYDLESLKRALRAIGFVDCEIADYEVGFELIALYGDSDFYTHMARLLPNGMWTSKLGGLEDIEHNTPEAVAGGVYASLAGFLKRTI